MRGVGSYFCVPRLWGPRGCKYQVMDTRTPIPPFKKVGVLRTCAPLKMKSFLGKTPDYFLFDGDCFLGF